MVWVMTEMFSPVERRVSRSLTGPSMARTMYRDDLLPLQVLFARLSLMKEDDVRNRCYCDRGVRYISETSTQYNGWHL